MEQVAVRRRMTKEQRRVSILEAARRVVLASGLGVRVRDIADEAGVNEALIYQHFASKDELIAAAVVLPLERVVQQLDATAVPEPEGSDATVRGNVEMFLRRFLEAFAGSVSLFGLVLFSDRDTGAAFYRDHLVPVLDEAIGNVMSGMASWSHRDFDPLITVPASVGMCWWLAADADFRGRPLDVEAAAALLTGMLFDGLAARPGVAAQ